MIGKTLAHYEVTERLGAGGMGEVYRAKDTTLGRDVAIKLLPEIFANDPERIARFEREAKLLAALNHPNVAAIYGFERSGGACFLVLELVQGETLAERIARGRVEPHEALGIALQVADALQSAHEKGVIHRDLKPANIKITPEGKVKVLDFGLAKALASEPAATQLSQSPTLSMAATNAGVILGTAAYMSPEQAKGSLNVDSRTDIFSFGCVLYEMLTGRQAFQGESIPEVLASVIAREPDFSRLSRDLNPRLHELVGRCFEKDPKKRWHAAGDLRMEIETILADARGVEFRAKPAATRWPTWKVLSLAVVTAIAGAGIAAALLTRDRPSPSRDVTRFPFLLPEGQSLTASGTASRQLVAISPDGKSFAYLANRQLYVRAMADMQSRPIPAGQVLLPFFSPSGQWIGFYQDGYLKKVAVTGGAAVQLAPVAGAPPYSASWDGNMIIFASAGIFAVSEDGGKPEQWIKLDPGEFADSPQILPGGKSVMFSVTKAPIGTDRWDKGDVVVVTRATGERKLLIPGGGAARYVPTGHILYALGPNLMAVRFDVQQLKVVGGPIPMIEGILRSPSMNGSSTGNFDISANGTLLYVPGGSGSAALQRVLAIVDRNGKSEMLRLPPGSYDQPRASSKTRQVALTTSDDGVDTISIYDLSGTKSLRKLTLGGRSLFPRWSPDDRRLAFTGVQDGKTAIFLQNADGTGTPENLITAPGGDAYIPWSFDPAGTILAFTHCKNLADCGVFTVPLTGDKKIQTFAYEPVTGQYNATFSHDGHWLAYVSNEGPTRTRHIFVQQFPSGAKYQISQVPSEAPTWSLDDKELYYYQTESAKLAAVRIKTQPEFSFSDPVTLPIEGMIQAGGSPRQYDVMPDGRFLVLLTAPQATGTEVHPRQEIDVVLNWVEELRQRLPAR